MTGRPSIATDELKQDICDLIADGESLRSICEGDDMPDRRTILRWLDADTDFAAKYARAREMQADVMDEKILSVADNCKSEDAAAARVKIDAYKWRASKLAPKRYGERVTNEHTGEDGGALVINIVRHARNQPAE